MGESRAKTKHYLKTNTKKKCYELATSFSRVSLLSSLPVGWGDKRLENEVDELAGNVYTLE